MKKLQWTSGGVIGNGPTMQGSGTFEFEVYTEASVDLSETKKEMKLTINSPSKIVLVGIFADKYDQDENGKKSIIKSDKFGQLSAPVLLFGDFASKTMSGVTEINFTLEVSPPPAPAAGGAAAPSVPSKPPATRSIQVVIGTDLP